MKMMAQIINVQLLVGAILVLNSGCSSPETVTPLPPSMDITKVLPIRLGETSIGQMTVSLTGQDTVMANYGRGTWQYVTTTAEGVSIRIAVDLTIPETGVDHLLITFGSMRHLFYAQTASLRVGNSIDRTGDPFSQLLVGDFFMNFNTRLCRGDDYDYTFKRMSADILEKYAGQSIEFCMQGIISRYRLDENDIQLEEFYEEGFLIAKVEMSNVDDILQEREVVATTLGQYNNGLYPIHYAFK